MNQQWMVSAMKPAILVLSLFSLLLFAACDSGEDINDPPNTLFTISGKLTFNRPTQISSDARVGVFWYVPRSGAPDYGYIFGEGKVNLADSTFKVIFQKAPPDTALNRNNGMGKDIGLGVGAVLLFDRSMSEGVYGDDGDSLIEEHALGLATQHAVIYVKGNRDSVALIKSWGKDFNSGFGVGKGIARTGDDHFGPVSSSDIEIFIDNLKDLEWVEWE